MPECFQVWLEHLSQDDAKAMWEYFDGSFTNCEDVIFTICGSHPLLVLEMCGEEEEDKAK